MPKRMLCIDPGDSTGWAYFIDAKLKDSGKFSRKLKNNKIEEEHLKQLWFYFQKLIRDLEPARDCASGIHCYIEGVSLWGSSLKSMTAGRRGNLFKLAYLIGGYCNVCQYHNIQFCIIYPISWKGQMNKEAVKLRVKRAIGLEFKTEHETDAVGIGLSILNKL